MRDSGIYIRDINKDGKWDSILFEQLTRKQQEEWLSRFTELEPLKIVIYQLADALKECQGEDYDR